MAPSPAALKRALSLVEDPTWIWRSVVLAAVAPHEGPQRLSDRVEWLQNDPESYDEIIYRSDQALLGSKKLLLVFDALDVLANDWDTIRKLTIGLARVALEMTSRKCIRLKLFMRVDQFEDMRRKTFSDFSKLRTSAVELEWGWIDLYGALFTRLWRSHTSREAAREIAATIGLKLSDDLPLSLRRYEGTQQKFFAAFAGEFMGTNKKRGLTYTWVPKHLADGHGDTSLRSFLIAVKEAANAAHDRTSLAIDYVGINQGVLKASETRREEIQEDHPWIQDALFPLSGLTVPCEEGEIMTRWDEANVISKIQSRSDPERPAAPIQLSLIDLERDAWAGEVALMSALIELGIAERRAYDRINIPDIFRVAAKIKRKGGVAPRRR